MKATFGFGLAYCVLFGVIAGMPLDFSGAQDRDTLPIDAQNARAEYLGQRKTGLLRLNQVYLDKLKAIQEKYTKEGNLETALAIKAEIDRVTLESQEMLGEAASLPQNTDKAPTLALVANVATEITIEAKNEDGVTLGNLKKGDTITLQYVSGKWKSHGSLASENPDAAVISHGDDNRIGLFSKKVASSRPRLLTLVPAGTITKPFTFVVPDDFAAIVLRINIDPDNEWKSNPGSVVYRVQVKKGA